MQKPEGTKSQYYEKWTGEILPGSRQETHQIVFESSLRDHLLTTTTHWGMNEQVSNTNYYYSLSLAFIRPKNHHQRSIMARGQLIWTGHRPLLDLRNAFPSSNNSTKPDACWPYRGVGVAFASRPFLSSQQPPTHPVSYLVYLSDSTQAVINLQCSGPVPTRGQTERAPMKALHSTTKRCSLHTNWGRPSSELLGLKSPIVASSYVVGWPATTHLTCSHSTSRAETHLPVSGFDPGWWESEICPPPFKQWSEIVLVPVQASF